MQMSEYARKARVFHQRSVFWGAAVLTLFDNHPYEICQQLGVLSWARLPLPSLRRDLHLLSRSSGPHSIIYRVAR